MTIPEYSTSLVGISLLLCPAALMSFLGGNSLDKAPPGSVKNFVQSHGGHTVITKVRVPTNCLFFTFSSPGDRAGPHCQQRSAHYHSTLYILC